MSYDILHVGVDSIDSWRGGCTTHFLFEVLREIMRRFNDEVKLLDYPILTRLNPNIPWKTRGNGAMCLRLMVRSNITSSIEELLALMLKSYTQSYHDCDPAIAILHGELHKDFLDFYEKALRRVVALHEALELAQSHGVKVIKTRSGLGLIGALAAIGSLTEGDYTFEVLAYREGEEARLLDHDSVWTMEFETWPYTFNNVDPETGRILLTPRGPDPVLYGIRGEGPHILLKALSILKVHSKPIGYLIVRSNQGTDYHYLNVKRVKEVEPYSSILLRGEVASKPKVISGGHVVFKVSDGADELYCIAYKPSGDVRRASEKLEVGDEVEVYGGARRFLGSEILSINLEKLVILKARDEVVERNPLCPKCQKRLKSLGRVGGYKCSRCGFRTTEATKLALRKSRGEVEGMYLPPPRSMRHLAKPFRRYGLEKKGFYGLEEMNLGRVLIVGW
ncbi:MAG: tRNA(Ile)(2)-agmatinylcytidine synthase [Candidatus Nezhaarchaeota archaeon]|nr:tRNA(Ile)(2)-agmatinylcytidine synthase [Candidatus Nezhaarchaeota archaeon]